MYNEKYDKLHCCCVISNCIVYYWIINNRPVLHCVYDVVDVCFDVQHYGSVLYSKWMKANNVIPTLSLKHYVGVMTDGKIFNAYLSTCFQ